MRGIEERQVDCLQARQPSEAANDCGMEVSNEVERRHHQLDISKGSKGINPN